MELHELKLKYELIGTIWQLLRIFPDAPNENNRRVRFTITFGDGTAQVIDNEG